MSYAPISEEDEALGRRIIGAAIEVHRVLGPGFIESIYERALTHELVASGIGVECQKEIVVRYKGIEIPGQRLDLLVGSRVIVELKAVDQLSPIHTAIVLSYLKSTGLRPALVVNFRVEVLKDGIKRIVR